MSTDGRINNLGRQYIGAVSSNAADGIPGDNISDGNSPPAVFIPPSVFSPLAAALVAILLI